MFSSHSKEREGGWAYEKPVVLSLEFELVTQSDLEYRVAALNIFVYLGATDVVTSIETDVHVLVRNTYWYREVECINIFCIVFCNHETWLNTSLQCQTVSNIEVGKDRDVEVSWLPLGLNVNTFNVY